jgi:hypothetical protein
MEQGICKLCLVEKPLCDSHLMPQGFYYRVLGEEDNPHPVVVTERGSRESSLQVRGHVFCKDCEERFDRRGENYALRMVALRERFPLLEELESVKPSFAQKEWRAYNQRDTPGIDRDALTYFALSVFWRASVHTWRSADKGGEPVRIDLGDQNNEVLRRYLLDEGPIPTTMTLFFVVCTDRFSKGSFYLPSLSNKVGFQWNYGFAACGYFFSLMVGKGQGPERTSICFIHSLGRLICVRDGEAKLVEGYSSLIARQPPEKRWKPK